MSNNLNSSTFIFVRSLKENKVVQKKKKKVALEQRSKEMTLKEHIQKNTGIIFNDQKLYIYVWIYQLKINIGY